MNIQCLKCKGRHFCKREFCPLQVKIASQKKVNINAKQDYFGESPNIFVGRFGYPDINVGILNVEEYQNHDEPLLWSKENYQIGRIIDLRSAMINSSFKTDIKNPVSQNKNRFLELSQEISMAYRPVDVEINLNKKPIFNLSFNQDTMPHGPNVRLVKAKITENPKIPTSVEKAVSDTDLKAKDALISLRKRGFDEHYLTKILSVGNLGIKNQRKLVPTRWSITAVDDQIGKDIMQRIKDYKQADYAAYFGGYLGNYYLVLFFPDIWRYELFETYVGSAEYEWPFGTDYENYNGRKEYAENTAGGYYAARLSILEKLDQLKRQGSCLCLRFITNEYWAPLGVWVVREAARNAMKSKAIEFGSKDLMMIYAKHFVRKKFGYNLDNILKMSKLMKEVEKQGKLNSFF